MRAVALVESDGVAVCVGAQVRTELRLSDASLRALSLSVTCWSLSWRACSRVCCLTICVRGADSTCMRPAMMLSVSRPDESPLSWIPATCPPVLCRGRGLRRADGHDLAERDRPDDLAARVDQLGADAPTGVGRAELDRTTRRLQLVRDRRSAVDLVPDRHGHLGGAATDLGQVVDLGERAGVLRRVHRALTGRQM